MFVSIVSVHFVHRRLRRTDAGLNNGRANLTKDILARSSTSDGLKRCGMSAAAVCKNSSSRWGRG